MKPLVLIPSGDGTRTSPTPPGFPVETGLYIRFAEGDDVLVASPLEIDRARVQSKAARKLRFRRGGLRRPRRVRVVAAAGRQDAARARASTEARVSPRLQAALPGGAARGRASTSRSTASCSRPSGGTSPPRRRGFIRGGAARRRGRGDRGRPPARPGRDPGRGAVVGRPAAHLGAALRARPAAARRDGLQLPGHDRRRLARVRDAAFSRRRADPGGCAGDHRHLSVRPGHATTTATSRGPSWSARSPTRSGGCTRPSLQALDAGIESIRAGVPGRDVHHAVCQVLVDRGYGTTTKGFEGPEGGAEDEPQHRPRRRPRRARGAGAARTERRDRSRRATS